MTTPQTSKRKVINTVLVSVLSLLTLTFSIYGFTQNLLAKKAEQLSLEFQRRVLELQDQNSILTKELEQARMETEVQRKIAIENIELVQKARKK